MIIGIVSVGIFTVILGEFGFFSRPAASLTWLALILTGLGLGLTRQPRRHFSLIAQALPLTLAVLVGIVLILAHPNRSEWIVGGWDPGVYMNKAATLERTGTFYPSDAFFHDVFTEEEQEALTRKFRRGVERFPGVMIHKADQTLRFEFFRVTPSIFAAVQRVGGMESLYRANLIMGMFALLCFLAFVCKAFGGAPALFSTVLLAAQPILLFHTNFPTAEIIHLFLLFALLFVLVSHPPTVRGTLLAGLLLAVAVLNRFSFLPFAAILLFCLAAAEVLESPRTPLVTRRLALMGACMLSAFINFKVAPVSLSGWSASALPTMLYTTGAAFMGCFVVDAIGSIKQLRQWLRDMPSRVIDISATLFLLTLAASWLLREYFVKAQNMDNLARLVPYCGLLPMLAAGAGLLAILFLRPRLAPRLYAMIVFLAIVSWLLLLDKHIVDLYPWATRRYLPYLVPLIAICAGYLLAKLWRLSWPVHASRILSLSLFLLLLAVPAKTSWHAWNARQFNGVEAAISEAAKQIEPRDLIVADHPWWGTPLALLAGKNVVDGRGLWADKTGERMALIEPALQRASEQGWRIRFLTSTESAMAIFPAPQARIQFDWSGERLFFHDVVQHPSARGFHLQEQEVRLRLFTWRP
ncbi:hypothetical protein C6366_14065 [Desulfonatronum sp. SC1]|nr:hypothetical protein C6366_14065 [Desulfonatronum sp. SC1]